MTFPRLRAPDTTTTLTILEQDSATIESWRALVTETAGSYFQTPDWVLAWWRFLVGRPETHVAIWRDPDGDLSAIACLARVQERLHRHLPVPFRMWVNAGSGAGAGDHLGFPFRATDAAAVGAWLEARRGSVRLANMTPANTPPHGNFRLVGTTPTFVVHRRADGTDPLGSSTRKNVRKATREFEQAGGRILVLTGSEIDRTHLGDLLRLHGARFEGLGRRSHFTPDRLAFLEALAAMHGSGRGPVLTLAKLGGETIGADLSFRHGPVLYSYQGGWDPAHGRFSLGSILLAHSIRWAFEQGMSSVDLLRGNPGYKARFGAVPSEDIELLLAKGFAGALALARAQRGSRGAG